jgi:hypothetical protein
MLTFLAVSYLADIRNRQHFFEEFAEKKGFNPLVAENWYSIPFREIAAHQVCLPKYN